MRCYSWFRAVVLLITCLLMATGCSSTPPPQIAPPVVLVSKPVPGKVKDYDYFTGRLDAEESVDIRARVTGYLDKIYFKPGAEVKEGDLLFLIDPRPYQADLEKAEGQVALYQAKVERANRDYERNRPLALKGAIGQQEFDKYVGDRDEAVGGLKAAQAALAGYKLNVDFCKVTAPVSGRVSRNYIDAGNLVSQDKTVLTNIVTLDPIYAYFDVDERSLLRIQQLIREGKMKSAREGHKIDIGLELASETKFPHQGYIDFVDNKVNPSTGTLRVRGIFPNKDRVLSAGLFCRVRVPVGQPHESLLVTERALGTDQGQKYVLIVDDKNVVQYRPVQVGSLTDGMREIDKGIQAEDRVIISGLQRVRPGVTVDPKPGKMQDLAGADSGTKPAPEKSVPKK